MARQDRRREVAGHRQRATVAEPTLLEVKLSEGCYCDVTVAEERNYFTSSPKCCAVYLLLLLERNVLSPQDHPHLGFTLELQFQTAEKNFMVISFSFPS